MKNASNTMYRIGRIFTIVELILGPILFIIGLIAVIAGSIKDPTDAALVSSGGTCIAWGVYFVVVAILQLIFVSKAQKELENRETRNPTPFILTIVFGAIAQNVFYVLAGIFGLIADGQQGDQEQPKEVENKEEPKE